MPGAGTHTTIIQRLAKLAQDNPDAAKFLTDPDPNADWGSYDSADALQSRYAMLGAMGPDIFYMMLDYGDPEQRPEDTVLKIAGTFRCVGELSSEVNNLVNSALDKLTVGVWQDIQDVFSNLKGILVDGILDLLVDKHNFWYFFLPLRQVDDYQDNWYWADFLHYVKLQAPDDPVFTTWTEFIADARRQTYTLTPAQVQAAVQLVGRASAPIPPGSTATVACPSYWMPGSAEAAQQGVLVQVRDLLMDPLTAPFDAVNDRHVARNDAIMDPIIF